MNSRSETFPRTEHPTTILTPALLRFCKKRIYPIYQYVRSKGIFSSREALIAYEEALRLEAAVDAMLEGNEDENLTNVKIDKWEKACMRATSVKISGKENTPDSSYIEAGGRFQYAEVEGRESPELMRETQAAVNARRVLRIFERVFPRWKELLMLNNGREERPHGLERFEEGWILTRIVYKGARAYGHIKEFHNEIDVLKALLEQKLWRRGKRGEWYNRWALILTFHMARKRGPGVTIDGEVFDQKVEREKILLEAKEIVEEGLADEDTHIGRFFFVYPA